MQTPPTPTPPRFNAAQRKPRHPSLLRTDIRSAALQELTLLQAKGLLVQALEELQHIDVDEADLQQAEHFHHAFVQILHTARVLHATVEAPVLEHMAHALRLHHTRHDRVAHALVSAWACVTVPAVTAAASAVLRAARTPSVKASADTSLAAAISAVRRSPPPEGWT